MKRQTKTKATLLCLLSLLLVVGSIQAAEIAELQQLLIKNVNVFNGTDDKLNSNMNVLVEKNLKLIVKDGVIYKNSL